MTEPTKEKTVLIDRSLLEKICSSQRWQTLLLKSFAAVSKPLSTETQITASKAAIIEMADKAFCQLEEDDWLEAFAGHPMIGDISSLHKKYAQGKNLSENEQSQVSSAPEEVLQSLLELNHAYLDKFGFIFIICASDKSAQEMLISLQGRINNSRTDELLNASVEQRKISHIRMEALL
ncbi:2-oxo-4-hydroxy-4-carboxy-5-ureidoimidazoline decarboxylase [Vibrio sp. TH_r3]|uniref:2-oxo-4-hydroxy-4-carboxy-5-ureidoimidazoline decarboxylase n=1 Tax=Vibrio sp. TH_r3 TaxID=3082084 RepID=UPI002952B2B1|nr:2-oxo-4-hydroxy-4-carboxy-5-ureidoimidazoline decarboxylase [Vibrio sp. TH_r3]MDV7104943.1 2-oxo-4-hydroxy-4-carboxy-5-ureidoimidazoline decarboxylase [Vibrio sp. TH_r3]